MARFDSAIALASRLIAKNGEEIKIRRREDGDPVDADKPWAPDEPTFDDADATGVFLSETEARQAGFLVKDGEQVVYVPASGLAVEPDPSVDSVVRASGEVWPIVKSEPLRPNGQNVLYVLTVKK